jgi:hypothetical protein
MASLLIAALIVATSSGTTAIEWKSSCRYHAKENCRHVLATERKKSRGGTHVKTGSANSNGRHGRVSIALENTHR